MAPSRQDAGRILFGAMLAGEAQVGAVRRAGRALGGGRSLTDAVAGRTVLITGASSGIGRATALRVAGAGATVLLVARGRDALHEVAALADSGGGVAHVHAADLAQRESIDALADSVLKQHGHVDVLINCAGHSIRRPIHRSYDRLHDFERTMQLNYLGPVHLTLRLLGQMRERGRGHVVNIGTMGTQTMPPQFSAYVASKAALDAFTQIAAAESGPDGVRFTTVHMPLVRTPMIEPTEAYDGMPALSPDEAAEMVATALRDRPRSVGTLTGTLGQVGHALVPGITGAVKRVAIGPR